MKVITKLRIAFVLYITLLAVLLAYHASTLRHVVTIGHELTEISSRVRATSTEQVTRVAELNENAAKYFVTHDRGYLDKFGQLYTAYDAELRHLTALPLSDEERQQVAELSQEWGTLGPLPRRLAKFTRLRSQAAIQDSLGTLRIALNALQQQTQRVGQASQVVMETQVAHSASAATAAERLSWISTAGILLLCLVISALIARSISEPLHRLTEGTRQVAQGQFDYRLDSSRDDEFAQVARDFNSMTERLGELDRMKRDFVSKVSHDLKTPLTSMQETINALLDEISGPITEKQRTLLLLNQQNGERLSSMLAKLLNLSRLEAGLELDLQMTDGAQLARLALDQASSAVGERGVHIDIDLPEHRLLLQCDPDRIRQVLDNLLENAIKFSHRGSHIHLTMHALETRPSQLTLARWRSIRSPHDPFCMMWITVADRGPGVPDDQKERIFERFYQTSAGRAVSGRGVGLGLTICREIVVAHGGLIWVEDNPGGGSVFSLLLPDALSTPSDSLLSTATLSPVPAAAASSGRYSLS